MKTRILILCFAIACICFTQRAQAESANEVFVAYGYAPQGTGVKPEVTLNLGQASSSLNPTDYLASYKAKNGTNAFTIGYLRSISNHIAIGLTYSYFQSKYDVDVFNKNDIAKSNNHAVMITGKYTWLTKEKFSLYSRAGIGIRFCGKNEYSLPESSELLKISYSNVKSGTKLAYQVSAIGFEYHIINALSVFAEGGIGNSGCVLCGIKTHF